jgi:hypothetical protein
VLEKVKFKVRLQSRSDRSRSLPCHAGLSSSSSGRATLQHVCLLALGKSILSDVANLWASISMMWAAIVGNINPKLALEQGKDRLGSTPSRERAATT